MCKTDYAPTDLPVLSYSTGLLPTPKLARECNAYALGAPLLDVPSRHPPCEVARAREAELQQLLQALTEKEQQLSRREAQLVERERDVERHLAAMQDIKLNLCSKCCAASNEPDDDDAKLDGEMELRAYWRTGKFIKSLVFGGLDGLTTTLALICSAVAAGEDTVSSKGILILGVATLLADAFSMGIGDFLSSLAEGDVLHTKASHALALRNGLVMFGAFVAFGGLPLLAFLPLAYRVRDRFRVSCVLCAFCLFALGSIKGKLEGQRMASAGVTMMVLGSIASVLSYYVSNGIHYLL